jgi:hypothetical protein
MTPLMTSSVLDMRKQYNFSQLCYWYEEESGSLLDTTSNGGNQHGSNNDDNLYTLFPARKQPLQVLTWQSVELYRRCRRCFYLAQQQSMVTSLQIYEKSAEIAADLVDQWQREGIWHCEADNGVALYEYARGYTLSVHAGQLVFSYEQAYSERMAWCALILGQLGHKVHPFAYLAPRTGGYDALCATAYEFQQLLAPHRIDIAHMERFLQEMITCMQRPVAPKAARSCGYCAYAAEPSGFCC